MQDVREIPPAYAEPAAEYWAVRRAVGLVDRRHYGVVEVTGRDRASFLHALLSNDVKALAPGQGCAATLLDIHGKVQVVVFVWALDDRILVVTPPGMAARTLEDLDRYLFSEKAYLKDATEETARFLLAGPGVAALVERLGGACPPAPPWSHVPAILDSVDVRLVSGGGETGEAEVWIVSGAGDGGRLWQTLVAAGARPVGTSAFEALRVEAGTPRFGGDVDDTVLLPEIPAAALLSQTKGCYPGQEVVVRIRDRGHVNRTLSGLVLDGDAVPAPGAELLSGEATVGRVTSGVFSYGLGRPIALGFVRREHAAPGARVTVRVGDRAVPATVSALPFPR